MPAVLMLAIAVGSAGSAVARVSERAEPPSAWWKAADQALERGDCARAVDLLEELLNKGETGALTPLGNIHESGRCAELGLPPAPRFYERMIERGFDIAKARLGYFYLEGRGVPRDAERARRLFKEAVLELVARVFPELRRRIMRSVMGRHGVPEELEAELDWADRIEAGPPRVQYATALRLRSGDGLPRHEDAAYEWLWKSAHRGVPDAWFEWGMWDLARACNDDDRRRAFRRIGRAATLNHPPALKEMGLRKAEGRGIERYDFGAMVLLLKAHWAGEDVAATLLEVGSRLNVHEKAVAVDLALRDEYIVTFSLGPSEAQPQPSASRACTSSRLSSWRR